MIGTPPVISSLSAVMGSLHRDHGEAVMMGPSHPPLHGGAPHCQQEGRSRPPPTKAPRTPGRSPSTCRFRGRPLPLMMGLGMTPPSISPPSAAIGGAPPCNPSHLPLPPPPLPQNPHERHLQGHVGPSPRGGAGGKKRSPPPTQHQRRSAKRNFRRLPWTLCYHCGQSGGRSPPLPRLLSG